MNETMLAAFTDELESIQKEAGVGGFVMKGLRGWRSAAKGVASGSRSVGKNFQNIGKLYQRGARGGGGVMGGLKGVAKSPYGAMAATGAAAAAVPVAAGYMGGRAARSDQQR